MASQSQMFVVFTSDSTGTSKGFVAAFTCSRPQLVSHSNSQQLADVQQQLIIKMATPRKECAPLVTRLVGRWGVSLDGRGDPMLSKEDVTIRKSENSSYYWEIVGGIGIRE